MPITKLIALLQDTPPAASGTNTAVRLIAGVLAVLLVVIIVLRRRGAKKKEEEEF